MNFTFYDVIFNLIFNDILLIFFWVRSFYFDVNFNYFLAIFYRDLRVDLGGWGVDFNGFLVTKIEIKHSLKFVD